MEQRGTLPVRVPAAATHEAEVQQQVREPRELRFLDVLGAARRFEEREATAQIFKKMRALIGDMAEKQGFTYVLEMNESGLLYGPPSLDLTNELVRAYNAANKSAKK